MKTINFKTFEENFDNVFNSVLKDNCILKVTTEIGNVVVLSQEEYKAMLGAIGPIPNKETIDAFKEVDDVTSGKKKTKKYSNVDELKKDLKLKK